MKQLDMSQPLLLITIGHPGAGKSNFAKQLAQQHQFAWIHGNRLRAWLSSLPTFSRKEEETVNQLSNYMLDELLRTKGNIVFDGNANSRISRQKLSKKAKDAGYKVLLVWLQTDRETAFARASKRSSRDDDLERQILSLDMFDRLVNQFSAPIPSDVYVVISGKHTFPTQVRTLFTKIHALQHPQPVKTTSSSQAAPKEKTKERPAIPSVEDIHRQRKPKGRSRPRFDITRHIKFR